MRGIIIVALITLNSVGYCQDVPKKDSLNLIDVFAKAQRQIESLDAALKQTTIRSKKTIDSLSSIANTNVDVNQKVKALTLKIDAIEKLERVKKENEKQQLNKRYEAGRVAISSMKAGAKIINFTQNVLDLEQTIDRTTNIWSDTTFRNGWNKLEDWGTVAGMVFVAGSAVSGSNETEKIGGIGIGAGILGVSKLLGNLFGINEKKLREKMERIDLSVRAYDDLLMRNKQLKFFLASNSSFDNRLTQFEIEYLNAKPEKIPLLMAKLLDILDDYKLILRQIPDYLDNIKTVSFGYINDKQKFKELPMKDIFGKIVEKCDEVKKQYNNDVKPILDISPEITQAIFGLDR